jgi:hypothetical protein
MLQDRGAFVATDSGPGLARITGPEFAEGSTRSDQTYRLAEVNSKESPVEDGKTHIGMVTETAATSAEQ